MTGLTAVVAETTPPLSDAGNAQLLIAALVGIAVVVVLIVVAKFHPFLALILGTAALGAVAEVPAGDIVASFLAGLGTTFASVGVLVALGAMLGKLLADSGGADQIVDTIIGRVGNRMLPWAMALIAAILGLPMFFEIGVVILVPIVVLVAGRTHNPLMRVGIPALAGLSILHGLVPPHPGPVAAIGLLHADLGLTLLFGLIVAVPTLIVSGPLLAIQIARWVPVYASEGAIVRAGLGSDVTDRTEPSPEPEREQPSRADSRPAAVDGGPVRQPTFFAALISIVLAVALMLIGAIGDLLLDDHSELRSVTNFFGTPVVALLVAVLVAMFAIGLGSGMKWERIQQSLGAGLPAVAGILLIVAAGGGFKQMLVDSGVANVIADQAENSSLSPLFLGWLVAVGIRLATGSATVATLTAAGIVSQLATTLSDSHDALLVLAIGSGSLFFSHVNDAGFWLVKEYFGLTVGQTIKSWSLMETVVSVMGLICVLLLSLLV